MLLPQTEPICLVFSHQFHPQLCLLPMTGFVSCLCVGVTEKPQKRWQGTGMSLLCYRALGATRLNIWQCHLSNYFHGVIPQYSMCVDTECRKVDLAIVTSIPRSTTHWAYIRGFIKRLISSYLTIGSNNIRVRTVSICCVCTKIWILLTTFCNCGMFFVLLHSSGVLR